MYYNNNQLITTINSENIYLSNDLKKIYYFTELNLKKNTGTLNIFDSDIKALIQKNLDLVFLIMCLCHL